MYRDPCKPSPFTALTAAGDCGIQSRQSCPATGRQLLPRQGPEPSDCPLLHQAPKGRHAYLSGCLRLTTMVITPTMAQPARCTGPMQLSCVLSDCALQLWPDKHSAVPNPHLTAAPLSPSPVSQRHTGEVSQLVPLQSRFASCGSCAPAAPLPLLSHHPRYWTAS